MDKYIEYDNIHDKICDVDIDIIYIAYIKTKNKKGFVYHEYGQGECLLFTSDNIEDSEPYPTIELLKKHLIYEGIKLEDVKIYKKVIETKTRYEEIK